MNAPLMVAVTSRLTEQGWAVFRFNYRGVGKSGGSYDRGVGELHDVQAAVDAAAAFLPDLPLGIAGWSFGAATSLRWLAKSGSEIPWAGIAPPVSSELTMPLPAPTELGPSPRTFIIGDRDQFTPVETLQDYVAEVGGQFHVIKGSDHFFYFREDKVATFVSQGLTA